MTSRISTALERSMKSFAIFVVLLLSSTFITALAAQQTADKNTGSAAASRKKEAKKDAKKDEAKDSNCKGGGQECPPHPDEKKPGMNADTFSGLKFRSIGPGAASG